MRGLRPLDIIEEERLMNTRQKNVLFMHTIETPCTYIAEALSHHHCIRTKTVEELIRRMDAFSSEGSKVDLLILHFGKKTTDETPDLLFLLLYLATRNPGQKFYVSMRGTMAGKVARFKEFFQSGRRVREKDELLDCLRRDGFLETEHVVA